jgi:hypothetical protein
MTKGSEDLVGELHALQSDMQRLADVFLRSAAKMKEVGLPPNDDLLQELHALRLRYSAFLAQIDEVTKGLSILSADRSQQPPSLHDIEEVLAQIQLTEKQHIESEKLHEESKTIVCQALAVAHRNELTFEPLAGFHQEVTRLLRVLAGPESEEIVALSKDLCSNSHPVANLVDLVRRGNDLDDSQVMQLSESVQIAFGKALAMAAVRGKLAIRQDSQGLSSDVTPSQQEPIVSPTPEPIVPSDISPPNTVPPPETERSPTELPVDRDPAHAIDPRLGQKLPTPAAALIAPSSAGTASDAPLTDHLVETSVYTPPTFGVSTSSSSPWWNHDSLSDEICIGDSGDFDDG